MNIRNFKGFGIFKAASALSLALIFPAASAAAVNFFNPTIAPPATLSATGVYSNIATKTVDTAMKYFEVNAALWSDGAAKKRWIILPPGTHITYVDTTDYFDYPNQTIFVKNFYLDTVLNDSTTRKYWETRLLVNKEDAQGKDYWYGFSYRWNAGATEANYVGSAGLDSVFNYYPKGLSGGLSYKKWFFPSADACTQCHKVGTADDGSGLKTARGVLGFFPAQLKRPSSIVAGTHQVDALFDVGVFVGTKPNATQKADRWKSISETLPATSQAEARFRSLDTMARSYIGANCSGCHGTRNIGVTGSAPFDLNYDFYRNKPVIEFGAQIVGSAGVDILNEDTTTLQDGRHKFILSVFKAGLPMTPGTTWDMSVPAGAIPSPTLISAGFPSLSMVLYRQLAMRRPTWRDSLRYVELLKDYDPTNIKSWVFVNPWGSQAWRNDLATHSMGVKDVVTFGGDGLQMPPLATFLPDTAAMKILGEWARTYRTLVRIDGKDSIVNINGRMTRFAAQGARIQNRQLIVPESWTGKAQMYSVGGRAYSLVSVGKGRYAIPQSAPSGLYFFKIGNRTFRSSVMK